MRLTLSERLVKKEACVGERVRVRANLNWSSLKLLYAKEGLSVSDKVSVLDNCWILKRDYQADNPSPV